MQKIISQILVNKQSNINPQFEMLSLIWGIKRVRMRARVIDGLYFNFNYSILMVVLVGLKKKVGFHLIFSSTILII